MGKIRGEMNIGFRADRGLYFFVLDLGMKPNGKRDRREFTSRSKNELVQKRREVIRQIEDGTYRSGKSSTVASWWEHWVDEIARRNVRPRTLANYRSYGRRHIIPHIGARRLPDLTPDDVRFLHDEMRAGGSSSRTVQAVHKTLSRALKDAVREGRVSRNVCDMMDIPRASMRERGAFSLPEARAVLAAAVEDGPCSASRAGMALLMGFRQAECLGLEWDRVDLDGGTVDMSWQLQRLPWAHGVGCGCGDGGTAARCSARRVDAPEGFEVRQCRGGMWWTRPKTSASVRLTPIPPRMGELLRDWADVAPANPHGLVWSSGGRPVDGRADREWWRGLCRRARVRELDLHSARHTMVTLLSEEGVSPEVIRQIAGHASVLATRNYLHVSTEQAREALGRLDLG